MFKIPILGTFTKAWMGKMTTQKITLWTLINPGLLIGWCSSNSHNLILKRYPTKETAVWVYSSGVDMIIDQWLNHWFSQWLFARCCTFWWSHQGEKAATYLKSVKSHCQLFRKDLKRHPLLENWSLRFQTWRAGKSPMNEDFIRKMSDKWM